MRSLAHSVVVITGGSSGIGLATASLVVARGGRAVLLGRSLGKLETAAAKLGPSVSVRPLDVTDEKAVREAFAAIGPIDHLVTAAAGTFRGRIDQLETSDARALFESKYWGQHHCVKYAAPHLGKTGSVVMFSGWVSRKPQPEMSTLAAIDGAIEALARTLALELAPIRVNAVTPGQIDTPLWRSRLSDEEARTHFERIAAAHPVGRAGTPADVAEAVVFLLENGFMNGAVLDVDGGWR